MQTYNRLPVTFSRGQGVWLEDQNGRRYLDALSGIAVCGLGHSHPRITRAIFEQSQRLLHTSNLYGIEAQSLLAQKLAALTDMEKIFFCNSGAEANECAIKIARQVGHQRGIATPGIIVMESAFHGRTLATLTATANPHAQKDFGPLLDGFYRVPFNDPDAVRALSDNRDIVAVFVEPVQGEGGVCVPETGYLQALRKTCDNNNWLLMLDEIQTGVGRTGHWYAFQAEGILPDVLTSAKGLGNGIPIGACLTRALAAQALGPGSHGTTFGGNPLSCSAALAVLDTIEQEGLLDNVRSVSRYILEELRNQLSDINGIQDIRNRGLMFGIELAWPCGELVTEALEAGLLINVTAGNTLRLLPPLILTREEADILVDRLVPLIKKFADRRGKSAVQLAPDSVCQ